MTDGGPVSRYPLSLPVFDGRASRRHRPVPVARLRAAALLARLRFGAVGRAEIFVQFAGYPRSNHSLIGSIVDAHPAAAVAHELDVMGLVENGFSEAEILALIRSNTASFERNGRWWNGFGYRIEGGAGGRSRNARVIGDKKGDLAVRRLVERPDLLDRLARTIRRRCVWVLVTRNPFDNIATMSLRKGRAYDRLRIDVADSEEFRARLRAEQGKTIASEALPEMIEDYAALSDGIAFLKERTPPQDWTEIRSEAFSALPVQEIGALLDVLELERHEDFLHRAGAAVRPSVNRSRHDVAWPDGRRAAVEAIIDKHDFLRGYTFDD